MHTCVQPDEGSVSQLCCTAWYSSTFYTLRRTMPFVNNIGNEPKLCFEASSWLVAGIGKDSEMAGANTFISDGCYRLLCDCHVCYSILFFSLPPSLPLSVCLWYVDCLTSSINICCVVLCSYRLPNDYQMSAVVGGDSFFDKWLFPCFFCTPALSHRCLSSSTFWKNVFQHCFT